MTPIYPIARFNTKFDSEKFNDLTFSEKGLILKFKNKAEREIPFEEVNQIYIKKYKLHPIAELAGIACPFVLIYMAMQYSAFELLTLASFFTIPPAFILVHNCKWYRLFVRLKDGTFFKKNVSENLKSENIRILEKLNYEHFYKAVGA